MSRLDGVQIRKDKSCATNLKIWASAVHLLSRLAGFAFTLCLASAARAQTYADPAGSGVFVNAAEWLQGTLLGTFATVAAIIAIAGVGFMMLTGRMNWRHGAIVIVGCFIIFGAASIVAGIQSAAGG